MKAEDTDVSEGQADSFSSTDASVESLIEGFLKALAMEQEDLPGLEARKLDSGKTV